MTQETAVRRQERGEARRRAILTAAVELLQQGRMSRVTHRSVADAAGVPLGAIRYYFHSREELLVACLGELEARHAAAGESAVAEAAALGGRAPAGRAAELAVRCWTGGLTTDAELRASLGWILDSTRESAVLASTLLAQRPAMDRRLQAVLDACGWRGADVGLIAAVVDGALVSGAVEGRAGLFGATAAVVARALEEWVDRRTGPRP